MYRITAKQLVLIALASAIATAAVVLLAQRAFVNRGAAVEPTAIADPTVATDEQNNIQVYQAVSPGVVNITATGYQRTLWGIYPSEGSGSGSVIDENGHILTNYHVVQNARKLEVQIGNDKFPASVVGSDRDDDLAVIRADIPRGYKLNIVKRGKSSDLQVGQKVLAIGNPFGLQRTLTTGVISGLERPLFDQAAGRTISGLIQTDASINPGNSGGPLLNARGEMIGINTAIISPGGQGSIGIGFAVPIEIANKVIPDLIAKGYVSRPWLGISPVPLTREIIMNFDLPVNEGLIVVQVYRGSGAAQAGLRPAVIGRSVWGDALLQNLGDVILSVDGKKVTSTDDLQNALIEKKPGETADVELFRGGSRVTVPVKLMERPAADR
jgi:S1-C subfamily serine protease